MRKLSISIVVLLLLVSLNVNVFAASNKYSLDDLGLEVTIPSGYSVITRDTPASAQIFDELGTTKLEVIEKFENGDIYLNAISNKYNEEIVVTMQENSITNFCLLSDIALETIASSLKSEYINYGVEITNHEIYQHSQAKFIKIDFKDAENTVRGMQFYTVYDGKAMNFTLRSYENERTFTDWSRQRTAIKAIVDSITYYNEPPVLKTREETPSFLYTDTDSGVTFIVPTNWKQEEFTAEREYLDAKFVSTNEVGTAIIFGSTDIWEQVPFNEKIGFSRKDLDNSFLTKADVAEMYGVSEKEISIVSYNGIKYYKGEITKVSDEYGLNLSVTTTQLTYVDNGWMYMFQFSGTDNHSLYSEFESLLNSISYHSASNASSENSSKQNSVSGIVIGLGVLVIVLAIIGAIIAVVIVFQKKKKLAQITKTAAVNDASSTDVLCKKCGQALVSDSVFCHACGTRVTNEEI